MSTKARAAAGAATILAVLSTVAPTTGGGSHSVRVDDILPSLAAPQTGVDSPPLAIDLNSLGNISPDSVRMLGSDEYGSYWVGQSTPSNVCLIMHVNGDNDVVASTCTPVTNFYQQGLGLLAGTSIGDPTLSAEIYLLPSDINAADLDVASSSRRTSAEPMNASLLTLQPYDPALSARTVERPDGSRFHFSPISAMQGRGQNG